LKRFSEASRIAPSPTDTMIISVKLATCMPIRVPHPAAKRGSARPRLENTPGPGETDRMIWHEVGDPDGEVH